MLEKNPRKIPSYRLHKPTGQAVVTLCGRDIYLGQHGVPASRERYDRLIAKWLANNRKLRDLHRSNRQSTVTELIAAFWRYAQAYYRKPDGTATSELSNYKQALRPLRRLYGSTPAAQFGPLDLQSVRQEMIRLGWSRKNINKQISRVRTVFRWGLEQEIIDTPVHERLRAVRGLARGRTEARDTDPIRPVPESLIEAIRPYVSRQVWALIQLQLLTGARAGELVGMRPVDLDTAGQVWVYAPASHKTAHHGHARTIYIGPKAQSVIKPFLPGRAVTTPLLSPRDAVAEKAIEAPSHRRPKQQPNRRATARTVGDHYTVASYRRAIQRACDKAFPPPDGMEGEEMRQWRKEHRWHPHQLRHNAATHIRREEGIEVARIILGHRSLGMTEVYAEQDTRKALEVIQRIG